MTTRAVVLAVFMAGLSLGVPARPALHAQHGAAQNVHYRFTFPEPEHRWMQAEAVFSGLTEQSLELRMSRSSPGRYALHDFAKNVYDVHAFGADGREIETTRPDPNGWTVSRFGSSLTVRYKVYGDRLDGTYLAIDRTHAHINMPAAIMWAHGLDDRPATVAFAEPAGAHWQVATQLHPTSNPLEFTAPNLQYLMDSPAEFGSGVLRTFSVDDGKFRVALHHAGTNADVDAYASDVEKIVRQERAVYGEFPRYEPGNYTFIVDYLPYAKGDGMEHRNSTVITEARSIRDQRTRLLGAVAHEFFHCWNVERIRPVGLEPFDFDRANMSDALWLAEGFTQYYGPLTLQRANLVALPETMDALADSVNAVVLSPAHLVRSAADMSRMAPFTDGGHEIDRTNWEATFISYYPFGGALALALDLTLRNRPHGGVTLDDYMRAMWRKYGKPGGTREGYVDHPYTIEDAEETLAEVSGDAAFAREFFSRYVEGHEVADYARLLSPAGLLVRKRHAGRAWLGDVQFERRPSELRVSELVQPNWPVYQAGLEQDDELRQLDGHRIATSDDVQEVLRRHKPGDRIDLVFVDRTGTAKTASVTLAEDPRLEIVPVEAAGDVLTPAQRAFRERWLGSKRTGPE